MRIILNETSHFGAGCRKELATELKARGLAKPLVVTDAPLLACGTAKKVTDILDAADIPYAIYSDIKANPTMANVNGCLDAYRTERADCFVAIGGGSVMDTAKAAAIIAANPDFADIVSLEGVAPTRHKAKPIFALPTTAGTGAEVTINYVITDEHRAKKMVCVDPHDIPVCAIVDAELMASMPAKLKAATGMDALTHAIEGYITKAAWTMTDMFELRAIELIARFLPRAVADGNDTEAVEGMALAQYIAAMGFSNVGLGIVHSMAHPLGAVYDIPHGVANALLLPTVMEFNKPAARAKYADIAKAMGVEGVASMPPDQAADAAVEAVRKLAIAVGIPQKLSGLGVPEGGLEKLSADALADVCTGGNPREVSQAEILALYRKVY